MRLLNVMWNLLDEYFTVVIVVVSTYMDAQFTIHAGGCIVCGVESNLLDFGVCAAIA